MEIANERIKKINDVLFLINTVRGYVGQVHEWKAKRKKSFSISIPTVDPIYFMVQEWIIKEVAKSQVYQNKITLVSRGNGEPSSMSRVLDDSTIELVIDGHKVLVESKKPSSSLDQLRADILGDRGREEGISAESIIFRTENKIAHELLLDIFDKLKAESLKRWRRPRLHLLSPYSYDLRSSDLPNRPIDSVVLADGQIERVVSDMDRFLHSEDEYSRRGIPWHRGYLFYGPPGTGKTSLAKALASHFGKDLYYYPMGSVNSDTELTKSFSNVPPNAIVLLEDVDVFQAAQERKAVEAKEKGERHTATLSGFLNVLDGVMTPHGMILIMTTNDKNHLDPAVLRPGRIDVSEELGLLEEKQGDRLFTSFYGESPSGPLNLTGIAPSAVMEVMKRNLYDAERAEHEIRESFH